MENIKKLPILLITIILIFGGIIMLSSCGKRSDRITLSLVTTPMSENDYTSKIPYMVENCDLSFFQPPTELSKTLAKTAVVLSSSAYDRDVTKTNLKSLGFSKIKSYNYDVNYDEKAVGVTFSVKVINETPVITAVMRGTFSKEWYSNFDIGKDVETTLVHKGFNEACDFVYKKLDEYKKEIGADDKNCRYFITGHSRGGAVANLLSKKLIDVYSSDVVYAYTFASPNTTLDKNVHNNEYRGIFNFVNCEDFIAFIPLESWGFQKYGTTKHLFSESGGEDYDEKYARANEKYKKYRNRELKTYGGTKKLREFLDSVYELTPTVEDYYGKRYTILDDEMSVYEFMETLAKLLNQEELITNGLILLNCDGTAFEDIKNYMMLGMDDSVSPFVDYDSSLICYTHSAESYLCHLEVFLEDL